MVLNAALVEWILLPAKGSEVNDIIIDASGKTKTNFSGGVQGGISNGNDIYCEVAFKTSCNNNAVAK